MSHILKQLNWNIQPRGNLVEQDGSFTFWGVIDDERDPEIHDSIVMLNPWQGWCTANNQRFHTFFRVCHEMWSPTKSWRFMSCLNQGTEDPFQLAFTKEDRINSVRGIDEYGPYEIIHPSDKTLHADIMMPSYGGGSNGLRLEGFKIHYGLSYVVFEGSDFFSSFRDFPNCPNLERRELRLDLSTFGLDDPPTCKNF